MRPVCMSNTLRSITSIGIKQKIPSGKTTVHCIENIVNQLQPKCNNIHITERIKILTFISLSSNPTKFANFFCDFKFLHVFLVITDERLITNQCSSLANS